MNQILANPGQNYLAGLSGGLQAGNAFQEMKARTADREKQASVQAFFAENGAALARGDPGAVDAYAAVDPMNAFDMRRQSQADVRATEQHNSTQALTSARLLEIRANGKRAVETHAAQMDDRERAETAADISRLLSSANAAFRQGPRELAAWVQQNVDAIREEGIDPAQVTYDAFPGIAAGYEGALEGLSAGVELGNSMVARPPQISAGFPRVPQTASLKPLPASSPPIKARRRDKAEHPCRQRKWRRVE